jgi:lipopolysaccharide export system permease protein
MFTTLLMAGTFLGRLTGYVVDGVPLWMIGQAFVYLMPALLAKTFSMAILLAALLAFGRLSSDSEIVAVRAGGASVPRLISPVALFGLVVAVATFAFNETVVPAATRAGLELANTIAASKSLNAQLPISRTEIQQGKLRLGIVAKNVNPADRTLQGVTLISYDDSGEEAFVMLAKELRFTSAQEWEVNGGATLITPDGSTVAKFTDRIWPDQITSIQSGFTDLVKERDDDFDALTITQLQDRIERFKKEGSRTPAQIANYEYGLWNKFSVPLAAVIFGSLGAVLGIRSHRTGTAAGFALAVAIIFVYVTLANFMAVWAQGGSVPSWVASFGPLLIGTVATGIIMWRRNG